MPGVGNTRFHLAGFVERLERQLPNFEVEVRPWGTPFHDDREPPRDERNFATAADIAAEIAAWRRAHPDAPFYLVGYSGGGGMVTLVTAALPDGVAIDRLYSSRPRSRPTIRSRNACCRTSREFVVNFASERDLQVGWGTRTFGTIDRKNTASAGAIGFALADPKLLQYLLVRRRHSVRSRAAITWRI